MTLKWKWLVGIIAALYLATGAWFGYALKVSLPAVNVFGATYVAMTWPFWLKASPVHLPIWKWCFSFK